MKGKAVEWIKKVLAISVFTVLFFSMSLSFLISLTSNIHALDVTAGFCPQTLQDVVVMDQDEQEMAKKHKILIEKNVIANENFLPRYDVIKHVMLTPNIPHFIELTNDIFYPPKTTAV